MRYFSIKKENTPHSTFIYSILKPCGSFLSSREGRPLEIYILENNSKMEVSLCIKYMEAQK